jgi:hypothetical protein
VISDTDQPTSEPGLDLSRLTDDELRALLALTRKATPGDQT